MNPSRTRRLMRLLGLLQNGRGHHSGTLAEECGVSRRTIFRDIQLLRASGVPVEFDASSRRFSIQGDFFLPATNFTPEEALAMVVLCHELGGQAGMPYLAAARSAAMKLESNLPPPLRTHVRGVSDAVRIQMDARSGLPERDDVYQRLIHAVHARQSVRIRYGSLFEGQEISTKLNPYCMLFSRHAWYVVGRSSLHRAVRTFHVGRIRQMDDLEDGFVVPKRFSIDKYLRNAWHLIVEKGRDRRVVVRFKPMVAQNVADVLWHKTQKLTFNGDGSLDFQVTVSGLREISWWILGYGDQAEVLQPPELRKIVAARCAAANRQYQRRARTKKKTTRPKKTNARRPSRRKKSSK